MSDLPFNPRIDRFDEAGAARLFRRFWPDEKIEAAVAEVLADSIRVAHETAPESWEVTLHPDHVRLNVGPVEALTLTADRFDFLVLLPLKVKNSRHVRLERSVTYRSVRRPNAACSLTPEGLSAIPEDVRSAHHEYIRAAAARRRKSIWPKSFSPSVLRRVETLLGTELPRPPYFDGAPLPSVSPLPDELRTDDGSLDEGAKYEVTVNAYERDPEARRRCIEHYGSSCFVCGFSFGRTYGAAFDGYIHVHHLRPLSKIGKRYRVDPVEDLRPVCPNCHAAAHRREPPFTPDELRERLKRAAPVNQR